MADENKTPKAMGEDLVDQLEEQRTNVAEQMATADNRPDSLLNPVGLATEVEAEKSPKPIEGEGKTSDEPKAAAIPEKGRTMYTRGLPADEIREGAAKAAEAKAEGKKKKGGLWHNWLRPVVVLMCICLVTSFLLGFTNQITLPLIAANAAKAADEARAQVLPQADGFEDVTPSPLPTNVLSVYKATNDAGYVIEAYGRGYGGEVPAMVGYDTGGNITGVTFPTNNETPGLGQNLSTSPTFASQFPGMEADIIEIQDIDALAGATLSTNAALVAINAANQYYTVELLGQTARYELSDEVWALLLPMAGEWRDLDVTGPGLAGVYLGDDGTYVIVAQGTGNNAKPITVAVAMDEEGVILNLFVDAEGETDGLGVGMGNDIKNNQDFMGSFIGRTDVDGIDDVAGSTYTSSGVKQAVQLALDTLPLAKEAA